MVLFFCFLISATVVLAEGDKEFKCINGYGKTGQEIIGIFNKVDPILGNVCSDTYSGKLGAECRESCDRMVALFAHLAEEEKIHKERTIRSFWFALPRKKFFDRAYATHGDQIDALRTANKECKDVAEQLYVALKAYRDAHPELLENGDDASHETVKVSDKIIGGIVFDVIVNNQVGDSTESAAKTSENND